MEEIWSLYQDLTSRYKFSAVCRRKLSVVFEAAFYVFVGTKWKKVNFEKNAFIIFGFIAKLFWPIVKNFSGVLSNVLCTCPWDHFDEKDFQGRNSVFLSYSDIELIFSDFCRLIFCGVFKSAFYVSIGTFRRKKISEKVCELFKQFRILCEQFLSFCHKNFVVALKNGFDVSKGTFWSKKILFENCSNFKTYSYIEQHKIRFFVQKVSAGSSKLYPMFLLEHNEEKFCFWKSLHFFKPLSDLGWRNFGFLPQKTRKVAKKEIDVSIGPVWTMRFFLKDIWYLYHIRISSYKFSTLCPLTFYGVFKAALYVFKEANWKK